MGLNEYDDTVEQLAPSTAPSANPYDDTVQALGQQQTQKLRTTLTTAQSGPAPDHAAEARTLGESLGLPTDVVLRNFDQVKKRAAAQATPIEQVLRETPALGQWAADPQNAAVAHDDMESLGALEWLVTAPQRAFAQGVNQFKYGTLRSQSLVRALTREEQDLLASYKLHMEAGGALGAGKSWFAGAITGGAQQLPNLFGAGLYGLKYGLAGALETGAAGALAGSVLPGAGTMAGGVAGAGYGFTAGMLYGGWKATAQLEAGLAYDEYLGFKDEHGQPIDPAVAKAAALATGAINGGLELVALEKIVHSIPGIRRLGSVGVKSAIGEALRVPTVRAALFEAVKSYGATLSTEALTEVAQRAVTILSGELAKASGQSGQVPGQLARGNVDLFKQPKVTNPDGTTSTVDSLSVGIDGQEVLLPTVTPDGRHLKSPEEAIAEYQQTGKHLGIFDSPASATAYAQQLHEDYAAGKYEGKSKYRSGASIVEDLVNEFTGAIQGFALTVLPGPAMDVVIGTQRARRAEHNATFFKALGEGVANSKTAQRMPAAAQAFLAEATKDGPVEHVYAPLDTWNTYWQSKGLDPEAVAKDVTGKVDAYQQAMNTGGDLAIPTARYAVKLAATEHNGFFAQELRLGPDEMNAREADAFETQMTAADTEPRVTAPDNPIRTAMLAQLKNAGVPLQTADAYAGLYEAALTTIADRAGVDPTALYERYGLQVERPELGQPPKAQEAAPEAPGATTAETVPVTGEGLPLATVPASGLPAGQAERRTENVGPPAGQAERRAGLNKEALDRPIDVMANVGAAALQMRAEGIKPGTKGARAVFLAHGPDGPLYNIIGGPKDKSTVSAAALKTEGIPVPPTPADTGERLSGAQIRERLLAARAAATETEAPAAPVLEVTPVDTTAVNPETGAPDAAAGSEESGYADRLRRARERGVPASYPRERESHKQREQRRAAHYDAAFADLLDAARALDPAVDPTDLRAEFDTRVQELESRLAEQAESGHDPTNLLRSIARYGGLNTVDATFPGELRYLQDGSTFGRIAGVSKVFQKTGVSLDDMLTQLQQDQRFQWIENPSMLIDAIDDAVRHGAQTDFFPGNGELWTDAQMDPTQAWWKDSWRPVNLLREELSETLDTGEGDTSFNAAEFDQSLFDDLTPPDATAEQLTESGAKTDKLDTGEVQPRLPGDVGEVRETEKATPTFDAPFTLTGEIRKATAAQKTLFQTETLTPELVKAWALDVKQRAGTDLRDFDVYLTREGDLHLDTIAVERGAQRAGLGGKVMNELTRFADAHGRRITLQLANKGYLTGTTSRSRLVTFYKRFGFVENKGRYKDFALSLYAHMYREPTLPAREGLRNDRAANLKAWFGQSAVVDDEGQPLVVYHGTTASFDTFETERGNIESDFGRGIYFSNNPRDVGANYAGIGPDLESKIQRRAEQLAQERDVKYDDPTARADAEAEFVTHGGLTMPVYLKLENPAILGGAGESRLEMEHPRDEEGDFVGEPTGTLIDFVQAIQALDQHEDAQHALQKILEVSDYESITVRNAVDILKRDDRFSTSTDDETGDMNAHEIIRQALEKVGFDGVIDRSVDTKFGSQKKIGKPMEGMDAETVHYIAFRPDQIKSAIGNAGTFNPHEPNILRQDRRGAIRFGPDRQFTIALLEKADLSTFLHESGHFFLEVFGDVVDQARAIEETARTPQQQQLLADYQTLLAHLGVESREGIERAQHEQFAQSFEAYLFEGQAPSLELAPLFARFRAWLVGVYRSLRNLHVELTPEVRRVMDRLLASDRAIDDAEARRGVRPMFATAADAGMDASEFAVYTKTITEASQTARAQLDRKLLSEIRREQKAAWTAQQAEIRQTVTEETQQQPVYRALAAIQKGEHPNGQPLIEGLETRPLKLSRAILVDRYGEERLKRLPRNPYLYAVDGGLDPEVLAKMFGFTSGDAMLTALEQAPPMDAVIGAEAKRRMLTAHGSLLLDGTLPEAAQAAVANTERELVLRAELRALARKRRELDPFLKHERATKQSALDDAEKERAYERRWFEAEHKLALAIAVGRKQSEVDGLEREVKDLRAKARGGAAYIRAAVPPTSVLKDIAATRLSGLTIREIDPQRFWSASRRAGLQALERAARQDLDGAIVAKQQELVNLHMFRAAEDIVADVQERTEDALDLTSKTRRATIGEAGQNYLDQIDGLLDRFGFAQASPQVLDRRPELRKFVAGIEATGQAVDLPEELFDESRRRNYKDLTVDEFIGVSDGLKAIVHLALMKNRLLRAQERAELDAAATTIADSIREHTTRRREPPARDRRASAERGRTIDDVFASHRKMSSLARELDGFEDGGAFWSGIIRPLNDAGAREATMNAEAAHKFSDLVEAAYPRGEKRDLYQKLEVPAVGESLSKMERIMIALNWGNEGNRDRIRRSEHWSDEQVHAVLATLDERDATFVQGVFDLIDGYWAEIKAKQERVYGIAPEKVEAVPFKLGARELAGGYFPLRYDERLSAKVGGQLDLETSALARQSAYVQATTKRGHTKERLTSVQLPVRRDFGVMFEHVKTVIHDLTHHEALIDVTRLLGHQAVQSAIYETHGDIIYRQFKNGIRDVAFGDIPATNAFERSLNHLRSGATIAGLGWSLSTALLQPIGLTQSMARIGPKWVGVGLSRWLRGSVQMEHTASWINEKSAMMRTRTITQQREINEIRNTLGVGTGKFSGLVDDVLGKLTFDTVTKQGIADSYFYLITQMQRIADIPTWLGQYEKSMAAGESEDRAIAIADQAVLDAQGGGQNKDLASVQRGGPLLKLWTNFYSFFNVTYNLTAEATHRATKTDPASLGRLGVDYLLLYSIPASLGYLLREGMRGNVDPDNPDQTWIGLLRENLSYMMGTVLGLRELAGVVQGYYGYEGPAGARAFSAAGKLVQQSIQAAKKISEGDAADAFDEAFWKSLNATGGILFHYPASQLQRTVQGVAAISEGKTQNPGVLVGGVPKEQKK